MLFVRKNHFYRYWFFIALYYFVIYPLSLPPKFYTIGNKVFKGNLSLLVRIDAFIASF